jgi:hypothetical protein
VGELPAVREERCYFCGKFFPLDRLIRREEQVGRIAGHKDIRLVDVCFSCAKELDDAKKERDRLIVWGVLIFFAFLLLLILIIALSAR